MRSLRPIAEEQRRTGPGITTDLLRCVARFFAKLYDAGVSEHVGPEVYLAIVQPHSQANGGGYERHAVVMRADELAKAVGEGSLADYLARNPDAFRALGAAVTGAG